MYYCDREKVKVNISTNCKKVNSYISISEFFSGTINLACLINAGIAYCHAFHVLGDPTDKTTNSHVGIGRQAIV